MLVMLREELLPEKFKPKGVFGISQFIHLSIGNP
jgi:hypothetical protein